MFCIITEYLEKAIHPAAKRKKSEKSIAFHINLTHIPNKILVTKIVI